MLSNIPASAAQVTGYIHPVVLVSPEVKNMFSPEIFLYKPKFLFNLKSS